MGASGVGLLQDDEAADVYDMLVELFNDGRSKADILRSLREHFAELIADRGARHKFDLALALAMWERGLLDAPTLRRAQRIAVDGSAVKEWEDSAVECARRARVIKDLVQKLATPHPRPKKPSKPRRVQPLYARGTCISLPLPDGDFGAVMVVDCPEEIETHGPFQGLNTLCMLKYKEKQPPSIDVFEHGEWFEGDSWGEKVIEGCNLTRRECRNAPEGTTVVGILPQIPPGPKPSSSYGGWNSLRYGFILREKNGAFGPPFLRH